MRLLLLALALLAGCGSGEIEPRRMDVDNKPMPAAPAISY